MPESLEPKDRLGPKIIAILLYTVLGLALFYMIFIYQGGTPSDTISPSELRQVLANFRERQAERMTDQLDEMREVVTAMRDIRDESIDDAEITADVQMMLEAEEKRMRELATADPSGQPLHLIYDIGRAMEQEVVTLYREFLAARMIAVRPELSYEEAYELSATPRPTRPELDAAAIYRDITTTREGGGLSEFKAQIKRSTIEMREIQENINRLYAFTQKAQARGDMGMSVDLSADDLAMIDYRGPELMPDEMEFHQDPDIGDFNAIPGRRIVSGGKMADWMYVDSWYIIGPFPGDTRRQNLDVRFGPEANVNLDDVFVGKDDKQIRWRYKKAGYVNPKASSKTAYWKIEPQDVQRNAVYYYFTEIYSDAPRTVWIATATDDYGKLWVNDELVWQSPTYAKPYNATENIQSLDLKQGQNRVLFRLENGGGTTGLSLLIRQSLE